MEEETARQTDKELTPKKLMASKLPAEISKE